MSLWAPDPMRGVSPPVTPPLSAPIAAQLKLLAGTRWDVGLSRADVFSCRWGGRGVKRGRPHGGQKCGRAPSPQWLFNASLQRPDTWLIGPHFARGGRGSEEAPRERGSALINIALN